jgi:hypothetical protein
MARFIEFSLSQNLNIDACPISALPVTLVCFVKPIASTTNGVAIGLYNSASARLRIDLQVRATGAVRGIVDDGTTVVFPTTTVTGSTGSWLHAALVSSSTTSHRVYINGGNSALDTTSVPNSFASLNRIRLGMGGNTGGGARINAHLAEAAVWNVALNDQEIAALAAGTNPKLIRPENLVFYAPLYGDASPEPNLTIGGSTYNLTLTNSPITKEHAPVSPHLI